MITKKNETPLEAWEQKMVFRWIRSNQIKYPQLQLAYGTLNGVRLAPKLRKQMYEQGNRKGVPDIVLPCRDSWCNYSGLYIELKREKGGRVSVEQKAYIPLLVNEGYKACVCRGHLEAICVLKEYLGAI